MPASVVRADQTGPRPPGPARRAGASAQAVASAAFLQACWRYGAVVLHLAVFCPGIAQVAACGHSRFVSGAGCLGASLRRSRLPVKSRRPARRHGDCPTRTDSRLGRLPGACPACCGLLLERAPGGARACTCVCVCVRACARARRARTTGSSPRKPRPLRGRGAPGACAASRLTDRPAPAGSCSGPADRTRPQ